MSVRRLPVHTDERGRLLVAEDAEVGFPIRRAFVVTAVPSGAERGNHTVPCRLTLTLVAGGATVWTTPPGGSEVEHILVQPGDTVDLRSGDWVRYRLSGPEAAVLMLAEQPFSRDGGGA